MISRSKSNIRGIAESPIFSKKHEGSWSRKNAKFDWDKTEERKNLRTLIKIIKISNKSRNNTNNKTPTFKNKFLSDLLNKKNISPNKSLNVIIHKIKEIKKIFNENMKNSFTIDCRSIKDNLRKIRNVSNIGEYNSKSIKENSSIKISQSEIYKNRNNKIFLPKINIKKINNPNTYDLDYNKFFKNLVNKPPTKLDCNTNSNKNKYKKVQILTKNINLKNKKIVESSNISFYGTNSCDFFKKRNFFNSIYIS